VIGRDRAWHAHTFRAWGREVQAYIPATWCPVCVGRGTPRRTCTPCRIAMCQPRSKTLLRVISEPSQRSSRSARTPPTTTAPGCHGGSYVQGGSHVTTDIPWWYHTVIVTMGNHGHRRDDGDATPAAPARYRCPPLPSLTPPPPPRPFYRPRLLLPPPQSIPTNVGPTVWNAEMKPLRVALRVVSCQRANALPTDNVMGEIEWATFQRSEPC